MSNTTAEMDEARMGEIEALLEGRRCKEYPGLDEMRYGAVSDAEAGRLLSALRAERERVAALTGERDQWKTNVETAHVAMDRARVPDAAGAACNDPECNSHLVHRVKWLLARVGELEGELAAEREARAKAEAERDRLRESLSFYAEKSNWEIPQPEGYKGRSGLSRLTPVTDDRGRLARKAIAVQVPTPKETP